MSDQQGVRDTTRDAMEDVRRIHHLAHLGIIAPEERDRSINGIRRKLGLPPLDHPDNPPTLTPPQSTEGR